MITINVMVIITRTAAEIKYTLGDLAECLKIREIF